MTSMETKKPRTIHFQDMLDKAEERGFKPKFVMFDIWYASVENLKAIKKKQWHFLTRLKSNRSVNPDNTKKCASSSSDQTYFRMTKTY